MTRDYAWEHCCTMLESDWRALRQLSRDGKLAERNQRVVELVLDQGLTRAEVAWGLRMSRARISDILAESGRYTPKTREEVAAEGLARREKARALRASGMSFRAIGEELGVSGERARQLVLSRRYQQEAT